MHTNGSNFTLDVKPFSDIDETVVDLAFTLTGLFMFILNVISLIYLVRLVQHTTSVDRHFYRQLVCVASNDILNGLAMSLHRFAPIHDMPSARMCWTLVIVQVSLVCATQVNILSISIQRYFIALNARHNSGYTAIIDFKALVASNICFFAIPLSYMLVTMDLSYNMDLAVCAPVAVVTKEGLSVIGMVGTIALVPVSIASVLISLAAIRHFSITLRAVGPGAPNQGSEEEEATEIKRTEKHIVVKLFIILLMYMICVIPLAVVAVHVFMKHPVSDTLIALIMCVGYMNSISSPVVYMSRLSKYRVLLSRDFKRFVRIFTNKPRYMNETPIVEFLQTEKENVETSAV